MELRAFITEEFEKAGETQLAVYLPMFAAGLAAGIEALLDDRAGAGEGGFNPPLREVVLAAFREAGTGDALAASERYAAILAATVAATVAAARETTDEAALTAVADAAMRAAVVATPGTSYRRHHALLFARTIAKAVRKFEDV